MTELARFVAAVLDDLDAAGALADYLADAGREREAVLLRRRWKAWKSRRAWHVENVERCGCSECTDGLESHDESFRDYIRERFPRARIEDVRVWAMNRGCGHAVVMDGKWPVLACNPNLCWLVGTSEKPYPRTCRACRKALCTMEEAK